MGGILGGIGDSSIIVRHINDPLRFSLPETVNKNGENILVRIKGRHDPVIVPTVVVVEAMTRSLSSICFLPNALPHGGVCAEFYGCPSELRD